ncbi:MULTISPECIES: phage tail sheath subtilisin-like domain-containing protein [unclassified Streptomyces]|uniref:phage tail sheath family protein n=1 Tax=unclassified Streptomyces TaxID=2593676 RepID=UPI0033C05481
MSPQQPNPPRTISTTTGPFGPGIHLRETDGVRGTGLGAPVIRGLHTSVAAFVGDAPGLPDKPAFVRHPQEFIEAFAPRRGGDGTARSYVHDAVLGHFRNGGGGAWLLGTSAEGDRLGGYRAALARLERLPEVTLVVAPDLWRVEEEAQRVAELLAGHCRRVGNRVALLHTRAGLAPADVHKPFELPEPDAQFAAVHYPWITVTEPGGSEHVAPPSGHVAGLCCRVDVERGAYTAPVGPLVGVVHHERNVSDEEQEALGGVGVNCLRFVPGQGIWVTGARTLSAEADWTDLAVRRLVNHARASLAQGTWWAAFETNSAHLRSLVRQSAVMFLKGLWRQGALRGETADEAFHVVCDETNNSYAYDAPGTSATNGVNGASGVSSAGIGDPTRGRVVLDVGLATRRPGEFVTFRILHEAGHRNP